MGDLAKRFGEELRETRAGSGYTAAQIGKRIGAPERLVLSWEQGKSLPTYKHYTRLIQLFPSLPRYTPRDPRPSNKGNTKGRPHSEEENEKVGAGRRAFWERYGF